MKVGDLLKKIEDIEQNDLFVGDRFGGIFYHRFVYVKNIEGDVLILRYLDTHDKILISEKYFKFHKFLYFGKYEPSYQILKMESDNNNKIEMIFKNDTWKGIF